MLWINGITSKAWCQEKRQVHKRETWVKHFLPCGSNSDQRDYLEIGLTTSRTASLGPEIRSAEPWLLLPITQDDSSMLTTYEVTNFIFIYIEGSFNKVFLSRTKDSKSKKAKSKMVIFWNTLCHQCQNVYNIFRLEDLLNYNNCV